MSGSIQGAVLTAAILHPPHRQRRLFSLPTSSENRPQRFDQRSLLHSPGLSPGLLIYLPVEPADGEVVAELRVVVDYRVVGVGARPAPPPPAAVRSEGRTVLELELLDPSPSSALTLPSCRG